MIAFVFQEPSMLWLALLALVCGGLFYYAAQRRRRAVRIFSEGGGHGARRFLWRRDVQAVAVCLAVMMLALALARPGWNPMRERVKRETRDVIFVLDVSRSMLARDLKPDRLAHAKATIWACASRLDENQRLALVAFAGSSAIQCPLARDRRFFLSSLERVGQDLVAQGGTRIGDALRKVSEKLLTPAMFGFQDVILVTDGGDQESDPDGGAAELNELGASLMIVGVGNGGTGARIPGPGSTRDEAGGYLLHEGQEVWTKLETEGLDSTLDVIDPGRGLFHKGSAAEAAEKYLKFTEFLEKRQVEVELAERYEEGFPWFVGTAVIFLLIGFLVRVPPGRVAGAVAVILFATPGVTRADVEYDDTPSVIEGLTNGDVAEIERSINEMVEEMKMTPGGRLKIGKSQFEVKKVAAAVENYEAAVAMPECSVEIRRRCLFNMGHCSFRVASHYQSLADEMPSPEDEEEGIDRGHSAVMAMESFDESAGYFRAAYLLDRTDVDAARNMEIARIRADKIRKELDPDGSPSDQPGDESEKGEGEPEDGEKGDEGQDGDADETEPSEDFEDGESEDGDPNNLGSSQSALTDLNNQALPPPTLSPEDLLDEEALNNESRDKSSGRKGKPVERDW